MLTINVRNSRHIPNGPVVEATLTLFTRRRPWVHFHTRRYPDRRPKMAASSRNEAH